MDRSRARGMRLIKAKEGRAQVAYVESLWIKVRSQREEAVRLTPLIKL
jgi:hypothetical protein